MANARPLRSVLYIPGSKPRALDKARGLPVDAIIFDLEDAVSIEEKAAARETLAAALKDGGYGARMKIIRINGLATPWGADDAKAAITGDTPLWAMMETALGRLNAGQIATHPHLQGMGMGTNDLAKELQSRPRADRLGLQSSLGRCLLAAKAHGLAIIDGVYNAFKDEPGLDAECQQGRDMGFDGKTLIHPAQVDIANAAFSPSEADVDLARRQIEAFEAAEASGQGVAVVDGRIVENLHLVPARETLAKADAIAAMMEG